MWDALSASRPSLCIVTTPKKQGDTVRTVGLDLSPYMLAVAKTRDTSQEIEAWMHARAEATGLVSTSFDLITLQFVTHELPRQATLDIFREALRLLRPGGAIALVDNNPKSPVIQNLPPCALYPDEKYRTLERRLLHL